MLLEKGEIGRHLTSFDGKIRTEITKGIYIMTTQEHMDKATLLTKVRGGYDAFEQVLAPLNHEQMTTPGVNSSWTIKDNIAHISVWQLRVITMLDAILNHTNLPDLAIEEEDIDTANERLYQENKDRSLADVQQEFSMSAQQVMAYIEVMSDEQLNQPQVWLRGKSVLPYIIGNTYDHYQEHSQIIQRWLAEQAS
jgi:hypothetical protein